MNYHRITIEKYNEIWDTLETAKNRYLSSPVVDRWLSIRYGLVAVIENSIDFRPTRPTTYQFRIRDDHKFMAYLLRWS